MTTYSHAVVMGDLVASETAASPAQLHDLFNTAVDEENRLAADVLASPLTITLGDEFQGLCGRLSEGLTIVRRLRLRLLRQGVECRFALGVIKLETALNTERAWNMMGPGLSATRDRLADKRHPNAYRFVLPDEELVQPLIEAVCYSITMIERDWTERQREVIVASLSRQTPPPRLAAELGLSEATLYKIRRAGQYDFYRNQWDSVSSAVAALDLLYGLK